MNKLILAGAAALAVAFGAQAAEAHGHHGHGKHGHHPHHGNSNHFASRGDRHHHAGITFHCTGLTPTCVS